MSFNFVVTVTSIAGLILGGGWMFAGSRLFKRWGIDAHVDGLLIGRRALLTALCAVCTESNGGVFIV